MSCLFFLPLFHPGSPHKPNDHFQFRVDNLRSATHYHLSIYLKNQMGESAPIQLEAETLRPAERLVDHGGGAAAGEEDLMKIRGDFASSPSSSHERGEVVHEIDSNQGGQSQALLVAIWLSIVFALLLAFTCSTLFILRLLRRDRRSSGNQQPYFLRDPLQELLTSGSALLGGKSSVFSGETSAGDQLNAALNNGAGVNCVEDSIDELLLTSSALASSGQQGNSGDGPPDIIPSSFGYRADGFKRSSISKHFSSLALCTPFCFTNNTKRCSFSLQLIHHLPHHHL